MYHTALKMASQIAEPQTRSPNAYALMIAAGHMRMDAARKGPEGKSSALAGKVKLRCEQVDMQVASFTPLMGKYAYLWNVTLNRRLEEGRELFYEPDPSSRTRLCGVTVTSITMPLKRCQDVVYTGFEDAARMALAGPSRSRTKSHWDPAWLTAGVSKEGGQCRVVLNRAVARSGTDGLLLGENCYSFYGANLQVRLRPPHLLSGLFPLGPL